MQKNADGSYDIYFAPKPREGKEGNWLQTIPGKSWWLALPMYGPLEPWIDQTWVTNDFERSLGVNLKVPVPVVVHGSLARPDYRVGKGVVLLSLTDLATKIAVPQVLLVDAFGAAIAGNPCVKMATGGVEQPTAAPVEKLTEPVGQALKATTAVVERTGKVVKEAGGAVVVVKGAGGLLKGVGRAVGGASRRGTARDRYGTRRTLIESARAGRSCGRILGT